MHDLKITLKTLTPLWTGGVDGTCDRLHETGLIGSLRWWYEALVRGLGGHACDPTEHNCIYDEEKPDHGLCLVCQVFGATGWARRFRLSISAENTTSQGLDGPKQPIGNRFKRNSTTDRPSWYFRKGLGGIFTLSILPTQKEFDPHIILGVLKLIERHAGFGAKPQLGYGWVQIEQVKGATFSPDKFAAQLLNMACTRPGQSNGLPNLQEMFFAQVRTSDPNITATLNLRYDIRAKFRTTFSNNQKLRHWVCGTVSGDREASKIFFSQSINGVMRVWGWIPDLHADFQGITRERGVKEIKQTIANFGKIESWREFNSDRDTRGRHSDVSKYLLSLLEER